jgi:DNA-binding NarL/FixJ family response regulator
MEVVAEAENGHRAFSEAKRLQPDLVLMDIAMPLLNGTAAAQRITLELPAVKVLILSSYDDDEHVRQAIEAGAAGYLMKSAASEDLLQAIREIHDGNAFFSPPITKGLLKQWRNYALEPRIPKLTLRQTEVVQLIAEGYATKQIADVLSLNMKTVEKHRQALMHKLGIHKVASLTRYAVSCGVVEVNRPDTGGPPDHPERSKVQENLVTGI